MSIWKKVAIGALTGLGMTLVAHAYGPGNPANLTAVPPGFKECGVDGAVCKVPAGQTVFVVYGTNGKFATAQGTGDFTCLPKGWVATPSASKPQDLGIPDPVPNVQKKCYVQVAPPAPPAAAPQGKMACYWMESKPPYNWVPSPMPAPDQAACKRLDSCSPDGGKASGGGCYVWASEEQVKGENAKKAAPPPAPPGQGTPPGQANGIKVSQALYGANCAGKGKPDPNIKGTDPTKHIAAACDGKASCTYKVDHTAIGDPVFGCRKEYVVNYECVAGNSAPKHGSAKADPEASGKSVTLECAGQSKEKEKEKEGPKPVTPPAPPAPAAQAPGACFWMESKAPYNWVPSPMPAPTPADCKRLDSCSPDGGKASGGGCYIWATADQVKAENAKKAAPAPAPAPAAAKISWVAGPNVPANAVIGGQEPGRTLPVCRGAHQGGVHPGKVVAGRCNIGYGGAEITLNAFEVMTNSGADLAWVAGPNVPANAVIGGQEPGRTLPVCRGAHQGGVHPGKVVAGRCNIGYGGAEITLNTFEVLTQR